MQPRTSLPIRNMYAFLLLVSAFTQTSAQTTKVDGWAFALYVQSISVQVLARTCEQTDPGYLLRFTPVFKSWAAQYTQQIARGEQLYLEGLRNDLKGRDDPRLAQIEAGRQLLASPYPQQVGETMPQNAQMLSICENNLASIKPH